MRIRPAAAQLGSAGSAAQLDAGRVEELRSLADMFTHAPVIFAALSGPDHVLEGANQAFFAAIGAGRGNEALGLPVTETVPELVHQGLVHLLDGVYRTGVPFATQGASVLLGPAGSARHGYYDFSFEPRHDSAGRIMGVAFLAVDVTKQRRAHKLAAEQQALLEQIARNAPLSEVLDGMARAIEKLSPKVLVSVLLVDQSGRHLRHGAGPSLPDFYNQAIDGTEIGPRQGSCGTAAHRRKMVVVADIEGDDLWTDFKDLAREAGLAACWSTPIMSATGELLGTFAVYHRTPRAPRAEDLDLSTVFARTAALAIERDRAEHARRTAYAREQAASADLAFILETNTAVSRETHYPQNLQCLADLAVPALSPICTIDVLEDGYVRRVAAAAGTDLPPGAKEILAGQAPSSRAEGPVTRVLAGGVSEVAEGPPPSPWADLDLQVTSYMCVPLTARGRTFGVLTLVATADNPLDARSMALAEELARTAAASAETTRQYAHRARLAGDLQAGLLLAALPTVPGAQLAASYHPAGEGLEIGGDFYDVFPLPGDRWGLIIGDVCGRGAHAATTTALVRHTARAVAPLLPTPVAVAHAINRALLAQPNSQESFVTLIYAELQPGPTGLTLHLVRAGHPSPVLRRVDGTVSVPTTPGQLLGVSSDPVLHAETMELAGGDALVLVTDGILEVRDAEGTFFGEDRLVQAVQLAGTATAQQTLDAINTAVDGFTGGVAEDDQAALILVAR
ncbi:serine phosphatase RsbU (regulator of sigma subunit) [Streptacidiphilus sp. MAP12-16]|uniref:SpoIIE family protein phosphatase n=1 Tax=Streptacidiphilus sp. MAP12-16 TaxID=3156300 RepID=UPI0035153E83